MKNLTKLLFTLAVFSLSVICVSAQQNPASLEETMWVATPLSYYTANYGSSTATYYFKSNNQATLLVDYTIIKPPQFVVDPFTNQQKWTPAGVEPKHDENTGGAYRRTGNSVKIEFPEFVIVATIKGDKMEGEITDKNSNTKTKWIAEKVLRKSNTSSAAQVTGLSSDYKEIQDKISSSTKLKIGTYVVRATQSFYVSFSGITMEENVTFFIKVESVDSNGNVKASLDKGGGKGMLNGQVDSKGYLQLKGIYVDLYGNEQNFKMEATVENDTLINGKYLDASKSVEAKGIFNTGTSK